MVLSHSGAAAVYKHPRNVPDDLIKKLAAKGGVIQVNAYNAYMIDVPVNADRDKALAAVQAKYRGRRLTEADVVAQTAERRAVLAQYPIPRANFDDLMKHMMHVIKLVGVDHLGIGSDVFTRRPASCSASSRRSDATTPSAIKADAASPPVFRRVASTRASARFRRCAIRR